MSRRGPPVLGQRSGHVRELRRLPHHREGHRKTGAILTTEKSDATKKFLVLTYGFVTPTEDVKQAWGAWFASVGTHLVDPGSPIGRGTEITPDTRKDLDLQSPSPLVGYCILNAESLQDAESLVKTMPIIESVRIYEASAM